MAGLLQLAVSLTSLVAPKRLPPPPAARCSLYASSSFPPSALQAPEEALALMRRSLRDAMDGGLSRIHIDVAVPECDAASRGFQPERHASFAIAAAEEIAAVCSGPPLVLVHDLPSSEPLGSLAAAAGLRLRSLEASGAPRLGDADLSRPLLVLGPAGAAEHPQAAHARTAGEDVVVLFNHRPLGSPPAAPPVLATVPPSFTTAFELVPLALRPVLQSGSQGGGGSPGGSGSSSGGAAAVKAVLARAHPSPWVLLVDAGGGYSEAGRFALRPTFASLVAEVGAAAFGSAAAAVPVGGAAEPDDAAALRAEAVARRAVAWFDELSLLEVVFGDALQHSPGGSSAADIEDAIARSGGNVSRLLPPEERRPPDGHGEALSRLAVSFSVVLDEGGGEGGGEPARALVQFPDAFPLDGAPPGFELQQLVGGGPPPADVAQAVAAAAAAAAVEAVAAEEGSPVYAAVGAAREALSSRGGGGGEARGEQRGGEASAAGGEVASGGAWAVLSDHGAGLHAVLPGRSPGHVRDTSPACSLPCSAGAELHAVLSAWDVGRSLSASSAAFRQAVQALAALGLCAREPSRAELDAMFAVLGRGAERLPLARLPEPLGLPAPSPDPPPTLLGAFPQAAPAARRRQRDGRAAAEGPRGAHVARDRQAGRPVV